MFRCQISRRLLQRTSSCRTQSFHPSTLQNSRFISTTSTRCARKDAQDKDSLNPTPNEYSKSGSDDAASAYPDAAFNPNKTSPEEETRTAEKEGGGPDNPLEVSPGNPEVSKPRGEQEGGAQGSPRETASGGGRAPKAGGNKSG